MFVYLLYWPSLFLFCSLNVLQDYQCFLFFHFAAAVSAIFYSMNLSTVIFCIIEKKKVSDTHFMWLRQSSVSCWITIECTISPQYESVGNRQETKTKWIMLKWRTLKITDGRRASGDNLLLAVCEASSISTAKCRIKSVLHHSLKRLYIWRRSRPHSKTEFIGSPQLKTTPT